MPGHKLWSDFNRAGRLNSIGRRQSGIDPTMPEPADETTPLVNGHLNGSTDAPLKIWGEEDRTVFTRWPKEFLHLTWLTLASSYVHVLVLVVPVAIIAGILHWNPTVVFVLCFIGIIPLASLLSFATEELAAKLGETLGGLLNASFGNAVELIVSISQKDACDALRCDKHFAMRVMRNSG